jgi:hypothetical protein
MIAEAIGVSVYISIVVLVIAYQHFKAMTKQGENYNG